MESFGSSGDDQIVHNLEGRKRAVKQYPGSHERARIRCRVSFVQYREIRFSVGRFKNLAVYFAFTCDGEGLRDGLTIVLIYLQSFENRRTKRA